MESFCGLCVYVQRVDKSFEQSPTLETGPRGSSGRFDFWCAANSLEEIADLRQGTRK